MIEDTFKERKVLSNEDLNNIFLDFFWAMNVCISSEMLAILLSAKNTCLDIVHKWRLGFDILSNFRHNINMVTSFHGQTNSLQIQQTFAQVKK